MALLSPFVRLSQAHATPFIGTGKTLSVPAGLSHAVRGFFLSVGLSTLALSACAQGNHFQTADADGRVIVRSADGSGDSSIAGHYLAGRFAQDQRDLGAAADFLMEALDNDPDNLDLINRTFQVLYMEGRIDEAEELAERLIGANAPGMMPRLFLAAQLAASEDYDTALSMLRSIPDTRLNAIVGPMARAWVLVGMGDRQDAFAALAELEKTPLGGLQPLHRAMIHDVVGETDRAETGYMEILASQDRPPLRLAQLLGNFFSRNQRTDRAEAVYNQFLVNNPGSDMVTKLAISAKDGDSDVDALLPNARAGFAEAMFDVASVLQRDRSHEMALMFVRTALLLKPDMMIGWILLGEILQSQERLNAAIEVYQGVPIDGPFGWTAALRTAELLDQVGRIDEALALLDRLAADRPDRWDPPHRKGDILRGRNRFKEAVMAYDVAVDRVGTIENRHWVLLYSRGIALEQSKQWDRAEIDFLKALELQPDQAYVLNYLGYSWLEMDKNLDEALDMIERAVAARPNDGYIVDSLGWGYYKLGRFEQAVVQLEKATALRPHDPTINDHLGDAYWKVGRVAEARFQWQRALGLDPDEELRAKIETKLVRGLVEALPAAASTEKDG